MKVSKIFSLEEIPIEDRRNYCDELATWSINVASFIPVFMRPAGFHFSNNNVKMFSIYKKQSINSTKSFTVFNSVFLFVYYNIF